MKSDYRMRDLKLQPSQKPGETAASLISRTATGFGTDAKTFCYHKGTSFLRVISGDRQAFDELDRYGVTIPHEVLSSSPVRKPLNVREFKNHNFPSKIIQSPEVRGCPVCLRLDAEMSDAPAHIAMAMRGNWLVPHVTLCLEHQHPLVPLWHDPVPASRYDSSAHLKILMPDILSGALDQDIREETDFDVWIEGRLRGEQNNGWLDQMPLHPAANFCFMLGSALLRHEMKTPSSAAREDHWALYQMGYDVAHHGRSKVATALRKLQKLPGGPQDGPKKIFPVLYERLATYYADNADYEPFRNLLRQHMLETWPLGVGDELLGEPVMERKAHSVLTAAQTTGVDQRRLRKMLAAVGVVRGAGSGLSDAWEVFDAELAKPILDKLTALVDAKAFAALIGATRSQFDMLVKDGVLTSELRDADVKAIWNPSAGHKFLDSIRMGAVQLRHAKRNWVHISKSAQRLKIGPGTIVRAIQDGRITRVGNHVSFVGYAAIYVDHDEVVTVLGPDAPGAESIEVFAKAVGINQPSKMRRLIVNGHTPATMMQNPKTRAEQNYLTADDADAFHSKFMTPRTMAKEYGRSWQSLGAELRSKGVDPFSPNGEVYGSLFLRSDVTKALR
ncbi:MAG: TniQ family protein [Sulfitobacter sp.]